MVFVALLCRAGVVLAVAEVQRGGVDSTHTAAGAEHRPTSAGESTADLQAMMAEVTEEALGDSDRSLRKEVMSQFELGGQPDGGDVDRALRKLVMSQGDAKRDSDPTLRKEDKSQLVGSGCDHEQAMAGDYLVALQLAEYREDFSLVDKDGGGAITTKELGILFESPPLSCQA